MNYNLEMEKEISSIPEGERLLLHACCAPCSSSVIERLSNHFRITIFYYNPNITDPDEYNKRVEEVNKFISKFKTKYQVDLLEGRYDREEFFSIAKGLEDAPERGARCYKCYRLRMEETARIADKYGYNYFATTLTLSPYKNADWVNEIGEELNKDYNTNYLYSDFKKKNGYKRSIELSHEYNLYRQDYCGCIYSKKERERKKNK